MKKPVLFIAIAFGVAMFFALEGCNKTNAPSLSARITGKWIMKSAIGDYTDYGVTQMDTTNFTTADYFNFEADGTLSIFQDSITHTGKWQITGTKLFITQTGYMDFAGGFDLPVLTNTDLQIRDTISTSFSTTEQNLNLYR